MKALVIYHGMDCIDGFTAAWVTFNVLKVGYHDVHCFAGVYGEAPPPVAGYDMVYIVDFSYPRPIMEKLIAEAKGLVCLDHHKTAQAALDGLLGGEIIFDMNRSGAMLAWDHFHPDTPAPVLVDYVQDHDLWNNKLIHTNEINSWIRSWPHDFWVWDDMARALEDSINKSEALTQGRAILRYQERSVDAHLECVQWQDVGGHHVPVVNCTDRNIVSKLGNALCQKYPEAPFAAYYSNMKPGVRTWGLRSVGTFDVSEVAKQLGGGGHCNAAGFQERVEHNGS